MPVVQEDGECSQKCDEQQLTPRHASIHGYLADAGLGGSMFSARILYDDGSQHTLLWCNVQAGQHQAMPTSKWHDLGIRPPDKSRIPLPKL